MKVPKVSKVRKVPKIPQVCKVLKVPRFVRCRVLRFLEVLWFPMQRFFWQLRFQGLQGPNAEFCSSSKLTGSKVYKFRMQSFLTNQVPSLTGLQVPRFLVPNAAFCNKSGSKVYSFPVSLVPNADFVFDFPLELYIVEQIRSSARKVRPRSLGLFFRKLWGTV